MLRSIGRLSPFAARGAAAAAAAAAGTALCFADRPASCEAPKLELKYFDGKGLAEQSRILMALSGVEYTNTRWKMDMAKPYGKRCPTFVEAQGNGSIYMALDRAPVLIADGVAFGQSKSIERYLARRVGLYGANELEAAQIDSFGEHLRDLKDLHGKAATDTEAADFKAKVLPAWLAKLERVAGDTKGCVVGNGLSLADVQLYYFICEHFPARDAYMKGPDAKPSGDDSGDPVATLLGDCPKLAASVVAIRDHPRVKTHVAGRQYTAPW